MAHSCLLDEFGKLVVRILKGMPAGYHVLLGCAPNGESLDSDRLGLTNTVNTLQRTVQNAHSVATGATYLDSLALYVSLPYRLAEDDPGGGDEVPVRRTVSNGTTEIEWHLQSTSTMLQLHQEHPIRLRSLKGKYQLLSVARRYLSTKAQVLDMNELHSLSDMR